MPLPPRIGGSFAPNITPEKLAAYRQIAASASAPVKDAILSLAKMVEIFQQTPASKQPGKPHPVGKGVIVPLEDKEIERIHEHVPWDYECDAYQSLFDKIPAEQKALRDAAFHCLWFARELTQDREPLTADKL